MSWGLWKKFKKGIKKAGMWLKDKLGKTANFAKKIKPELAKIDGQGWGKKLAKISDDIINVNDILQNRSSSEKVQKGDAIGAITYAGRQWTPQFRNSLSNVQ